MTWHALKLWGSKALLVMFHFMFIQHHHQHTRERKREREKREHAQLYSAIRKTAMMRASLGFQNETSSEMFVPTSWKSSVTR